MQANRLSAQRSRQRKLEKEASLRTDVEKLNGQIAELEAENRHLSSIEEGELSLCGVTTLHCCPLPYWTTEYAKISG